MRVQAMVDRLRTDRARERRLLFTQQEDLGQKQAALPGNSDQFGLALEPLPKPLEPLHAQQNNSDHFAQQPARRYAVYQADLAFFSPPQNLQSDVSENETPFYHTTNSKKHFMFHIHTLTLSETHHELWP